MPTNCEFQFNKINAVYFSGETVQGSIILNTSSAKDIRDVRIIFRGEAKVSWQETESRRGAGGKTSSHTVYFKSNEVYVDNSTFVRGEGTLPPGTHTYTFLIPLPLTCPTSCDGRYGHVRYELTLHINRPFRFDNVFNKPITVIRSYDLNLNPALRAPLACEDVTSSCFWSCSSGKILSTLKIPFGGYATGQTVNYTLHIQNQTMSDVDGYTIAFRKRMSFTAHTPRHKTRDDKSTLFEKTYDKPCLRLTNQLMEGNFIIPPTPPSNDNHSIISVEYCLKVTVHISGCCMDSDLSVPIFIGTIPLRESFPENYNRTHIIQPSAPDNLMSIEPFENSTLLPNVQPSAPEFPLDNNINKDLPPTYNDLNPPTFEEALRSSSPFIDTDRDERLRNTYFRPLYPMYSQSDK